MTEILRDFWEKYKKSGGKLKPLGRSRNLGIHTTKSQVVEPKGVSSRCGNLPKCLSYILIWGHTKNGTNETKITLSDINKI